MFSKGLMCHVFNLVIPKTQHISKTTTALTLVWMFFPFQTQRQVNKPYARGRAASWNTKLQMKLHASFPILAKAATQPAALLYHRGRTATGFIAARCHRAPFPSCFGRPAARSSAEEREERRGTIAPGSCALLAAPRRKPAPAVSPSARLPALAARPRGRRAPAGALRARALLKGLLRNIHTTRSPPAPQFTCRCRRGDDQVRPPTAARGSNGCSRPMAGAGRGGGRLPAAAGPFPHREGRSGAVCRRDGRLVSAPCGRVGRGICC